MNKQLNLKDYMLLALFNNVLFLALVLVLSLAVATQLTDQIIFATGLFGAFLLNGFFGTLNFWPHLLLQNFGKQKVRQVAMREPTNEPEVIVNNATAMLRAIDNGGKSPYIKADAIPETTTYLDEEVKTYKFKDIIFNFRVNPHTLILGRSGIGKTHSLFNIIETLKQQYPLARFVVVDFGNQDFVQTYPTDLDTFLKVTDAMFYIMKGRQQEGKDDNRTRIIWVVEEFESVLGEIKLLSTKEQTRFHQRLANIGRMARKTQLNMVFVAQSAKAEDFNTATRNNFANRFIMSIENSALARSLGCPYDVNSLKVGVAYNPSINAFVEFPESKEPPMDMIPYLDLMRLGNFYRDKYGLEEGESDERR